MFVDVRYDKAVQVYGSAAAFDKARAAIDEALGYQPSLEPLVVHFVDVDPADHAKLIGCVCEWGWGWFVVCFVVYCYVFVLVCFVFLCEI